MTIQHPSTIDGLRSLFAGARYLLSPDLKAFAVECIPCFAYGSLHAPEIVASIPKM